MGSFEDEAASRRSAWFEAHAAHSVQDYVPEVPIVVAAILNGPYSALDGGGLTDLICFEAQQQERALTEARRFMRAIDPGAGDARVLMAAARPPSSPIRTAIAKQTWTNWYWDGSARSRPSVSVLRRRRAFPPTCEARVQRRRDAGSRLISPRCTAEKLSSRSDDCSGRGLVPREPHQRGSPDSPDLARYRRKRPE
jgi:hypothetical protein